MKTLLFEPTDVLFFRDGRPMTGSLSGHTAGWPLPNVLNNALHAALWRSGLAESAHSHRPGRSGKHLSDDRAHRFGSLTTCGPFPVLAEAGKLEWFFPRPADALDAEGLPRVIQQPARRSTARSSLNARGLEHPAVRTIPPDKAIPKSWWNLSAWNRYLGAEPAGEAIPKFCNDQDFAAQEHQFGIEINAETGTVESGKFYSAHYLRLKQGWHLGAFGSGIDKGLNGDDLLGKLLGQTGRIAVGGQQRLCTARIVNSTPPTALPMPVGRSANFNTSGGKWLVKWILLSPAIWPDIPENPAKGIAAHGGGWLPNWISGDSEGRLRVRLRTGETERRADESRAAWRRRIRTECNDIQASLVSAIVPKPVVVTGWSLGMPESEALRRDPAAKPTHLAVPAGAVYYFAADSEADATALANALNWHGQTPGHDIVNRRSTLLGEKGFGIGLCDTWNFFGEPTA